MRGLPIVWVPGHLCGPWLYADQLARFGEAQPTIIADTASDDTLGAMAERLLDAVSGRFVIAGLSMGGMVAMEAMVRAPDRIAGAVLMDTDPTAAREKERDWRAAQVSKVCRRGLQTYVEGFVAKFFAHDTEAHARFVPLVEQMMGEIPVDVFEAQARALDTRRDLTGLLGAYRGPVEVLVGVEDRVCPPRLHAPIAEACPGGQLTELPGVGHLASLEAPGLVNDRIADLLARIPDA